MTVSYKTPRSTDTIIYTATSQNSPGNKTHIHRHTRTRTPKAGFIQIHLLLANYNEKYHYPHRTIHTITASNAYVLAHPLPPATRATGKYMEKSCKLWPKNNKKESH